MYKLVISPEAKNDLVEIKNYIAQELCNPQAAVNIITKITNKIRGLSAYPEMGAPLSSVVDIQTGYRFLVCAKYLIFYRYEDGNAFVSRILYSLRDYTHILFGDLLEEEK